MEGGERGTDDGGIPADRRTTTERLGAGKLAVALALAVALLSVVTGVAQIATAQFTGPLGAYVPPAVQQTAGFTGALTGFLVVVSALGLRRRFRAAWYAAVVLLPVAALQGLLQASLFSVPLVVLALAALPPLLLSRRHFDRRLTVGTAQLAATAALVTMLAYGTGGTYALSEEFRGVDTMLDALYYTLVTASTVGYGDAAPLTQRARLFGLSVVVVGTATFAVALGALLAPAIQARLAAALGRVNARQLRLMENHVIVLGYGELTEPILGELSDHVDFVVVTPDPSVAGDLSDRGVNVLTADPTDEEAQRRAGIEDARAVMAATSDDADDALSVLTASQLNPDARIVAAATDRENVGKLKRAGADTVISPAVIGGHLLVRSAMGGEGVEDIAERMLADERAPGYE